MVIHHSLILFAIYLVIWCNEECLLSSAMGDSSKSYEVTREGKCSYKRGLTCSCEGDGSVPVKGDGSVLVKGIEMF